MRSPRQRCTPLFLVASLSGAWTLATAACSSSGNDSGAGGASVSAGAAGTGTGGLLAHAGSAGTGGAGLAGGAAGGTTAAAGAGNGGTGGAQNGGVGGISGGGGIASAGGGSGGGATCPKPAGQICHEFYANDNSRNELHHVNEFEPAKSWVVKVGDTGANSARGIQLVDNQQAKTKQAVLVSVDKGFVEFDVVDGAELNRVNAFGSVTSALRVPSDATTQLPAGTTILARDLAPSELDFVDSKGVSVAPAAKLGFAGGTEIRKLERNPANGNLTFTKYESDTAAYVYEVTEQGSLLAKLKLPVGSKGYNALWRDGGNLLAASGSPCTILSLDSKGTVLGTLGGKNQFPAAGGGFIFSDVFSGIQLLPNGNVVVANWLGHVDASKHADTPELLEISAENQLVWSWGNQAAAALITYGYVVR